MQRIVTSLIVIASLAGTGYALAESQEPSTAIEATSQNDRTGKRFNRAPVDLEKFSRMDGLKAADTNGDGTLDREEIEAYALQQMVKRMADRMERRLDVDRDGTVTLSEIETQRGKEFAVLDRNDDGQLDRSELRAGKSQHGQRGPGFHRNHRGHGPHHMMHRR